MLLITSAYGVSSLGILCRLATLFWGQMLPFATSLCPAEQYNASAHCRAGVNELCYTSCANCTLCASAHQTEQTPCSESADAVCGACEAGYFLHVELGGCLKCSRCPEGSEVIHWFECEIAGLPVDQQCGPGEYNGSTTTSLPPSSSSSSSTTTTPSVGTSSGTNSNIGTVLEFNRGGFINESNTGSPDLTTATPPMEVKAGLMAASSVLMLLSLLLVLAVSCCWMKSRLRRIIAGRREHLHVHMEQLIEESGSESTGREYRAAVVSSHHHHQTFV